MNPKTIWTLRGYDTFANESYPIAGAFPTRADAERAARDWLRELEIQQPSSSSAGQTGVQDRVFVIGPDGASYRCLPGDPARE